MRHIKLPVQFHLDIYIVVVVWMQITWDPLNGVVKIILA